MNDRVSAELLDKPRDRCPSCRAPIVGTNPTDFLASKACFLHSRYAEFVANIGIDEAFKFELEDIVLRVLILKMQASF